MRRKLIINWSPAHERLREAVEIGVEHPSEVGMTSKGWSYCTFCTSKCGPNELLYDIDRIESIARDNGFYMPGEVVRQHNKILVVAHSAARDASPQLYGLWRFLMDFEKCFNKTDEFPKHNFFGKFGGKFDRSEKGRVLAMYSKGGDDALMAIYESCERLAKQVEVPGVTFEVGVSAGLSAIPRMLAGFDDPEYRATGVDMYRINNPAEFEQMLKTAKADFPKYPFFMPK